MYRPTMQQIMEKVNEATRLTNEKLKSIFGNNFNENSLEWANLFNVYYPIFHKQLN